MDRTTSDLSGAREVAKYLIAQAANINDATPEDVNLLAADLLGWTEHGTRPLDEAAANLMVTLQGQGHPKGFWKTALAMYLAQLRRDGVTGVEYRGQM